MKKILSILLCFAMTAFMAMAAENSSDSQEHASIEADKFEYAAEGQNAIGYGNVIFRKGDLTVYADRVSYDQVTNDYVAEGKVRVEKAGVGSWTADAVRGNVADRTMQFGPFRMDGEVWHGQGEGGEAQKNGDKVMKKSWISSCDLPEPHYALQASRIVWREKNHTFWGRNVLIKIGGVPIFWLPYFWGKTDTHVGFAVQPGYSSSRGAFMRLIRARTLDNGVKYETYVDLMSKRGVGGGVSAKYKTQEREFNVDTYIVHDNDPNEDEDGWNDRFKTDQTRYRVAAYWRESPTENLTWRTNLDWTSDVDMLEEWFSDAYHSNNQPKTSTTLSYDNSWMNAQLTVRPRVNDYNTEVESLPELKINIPKLKLGDTGLVYDSQNSVGFYRMTFRDYDKRPEDIRQQPGINDRYEFNDYHSGRFDTLHTLSLPIDVFGDFTITPRASGRITAYSRTSKKKVTQEDIADAIDADDLDIGNKYMFSKNWGEGYDSEGGSRVRYAAELGIEGRTRLYSEWLDYVNEPLGINGLRHIMIPYFNYTFSPNPNVNRDNIYYFDEVDRLTKQNFLRLGWDNVWQTHRNGKVTDLVRLENYYDWHFFRGEESDRRAGDFATRLTLYPMDKLRVWFSHLYDCGEKEAHSYTAGLQYGQKGDVQFKVEYQYLKDHLSRSTYSMGSYLADFTGESGYNKRNFGHSETISSTLSIPLDSRTTFDVNCKFDFDKDTFPSHNYMITREMHCWIWGFGAGWKDNDFELLFSLTLTAFPDNFMKMNF